MGGTIVAVFAAAVAYATVSLTSSGHRPTDDNNGYPGAGMPTELRLAARTVPTAPPPPGYDINGIDVSSHDHTNGRAPDWRARRAAGDEFAYIKVTEGTEYVNPYFAKDYEEAKQAGLYVGAYHFARPDLRKPAEEARFFARHMQWVRDGQTLPPFVDLEWPYFDADTCYGLSPKEMRTWISTFLTTLEGIIGVKPMIYTNANWWNPCTDSSGDFRDYPLDISSCSDAPPTMPGWGRNWTFWQYDIPDCDRGGVYDYDVFRGTLEELAALAAGAPITAAAPPGYADVNGDGRSDLITTGEDGTAQVLLSGGAFADPVTWRKGAVTGSAATLLADVTGDGRADLVAHDGNRTRVLTSNGRDFSAPATWSSASVNASVATLVGDVNGDGRADLIVVDRAGTSVLLAERSAFAAPVSWSTTAFDGQIADLVGDVNGDGRADLIAQDGNQVRVMLSTGSSFADPATWSEAFFFGTVANLAGDVNGDGRADLVAVDAGRVRVMLSTGTGFAAPTTWSQTAMNGSVTDLVADVNGDGRADLIAQDDGRARVMLSTGTGFAPPSTGAGMIVATAAIFGTNPSKMRNRAAA